MQSGASASLDEICGQQMGDDFTAQLLYVDGSPRINSMCCIESRGEDFFYVKAPTKYVP